MSEIHRNDGAEYPSTVAPYPPPASAEAAVEEFTRYHHHPIIAQLNKELAASREKVRVMSSELLECHAAITAATSVHKSVCEIIGVECLPSQLPRFVGEKLFTANQQNAALVERINEIYLAVEGQIDGAPDRSAASSLANQVAALCENSVSQSAKRFVALDSEIMLALISHAKNNSHNHGHIWAVCGCDECKLTRLLKYLFSAARNEAGIYKSVTPES